MSVSDSISNLFSIFDRWDLTFNHWSKTSASSIICCWIIDIHSFPWLMCSFHILLFPFEIENKGFMALPCVTIATMSPLTIHTTWCMHFIHHYGMGALQGHINAQLSANIMQDFSYHDDFSMSAVMWRELECLKGMWNRWVWGDVAVCPFVSVWLHQCVVKSVCTVTLKAG